MWFERPEVASLAEAARFFPALVLTGARQVGKTALVAPRVPVGDARVVGLPSVAAAAETSPESFMQRLTEPLILDELGDAAPMLSEIVWRGGYPELWRNNDLPPQIFFAGWRPTSSATSGPSCA